MIKKILAIVVIVLGVANIAIGITFVSIGASTQSWMTTQMRNEKITLGVPDPDIAQGEVIDTADEAKRAGDIVRSHRHEIAPTYGDLLGGDRYDPTDPQQLTYAQALNLENYLYLATNSFGLTTVAIGAGVAMLLTGIAFAIVGALSLFWRRKAEPSAA
jgi:hypothetical protein